MIKSLEGKNKLGLMNIRLSEASFIKIKNYRFNFLMNDMCDITKATIILIAWQLVNRKIDEFWGVGKFEKIFRGRFFF